MAVADSETTLDPGRPVDLALTLAPLRRAGPFDPAVRFERDGVWRATRTPEGPATIHLARNSSGVRVRAWGPGAAWAVNQAPDLLGARDDDSGFVPAHPLIAELHRRYRGLRMTRTAAVFEAVVPTILEQKVPGIQARRSYRMLVQTLGEAAPGPPGLLVPPSPRRLATTPDWAFHRLGVERRRAEVILRAAAAAARLEEAVVMPPAEARRRLSALPGLGPWSVAEVARVALGDADAVSIGDFHLPHLVCWALSGVARGDDARMLELLDPYRDHRGRVQRLLEISGISAPRFGPRLPLVSIAGR